MAKNVFQCRDSHRIVFEWFLFNRLFGKRPAVGELPYSISIEIFIQARFIDSCFSSYSNRTDSIRCGIMLSSVMSSSTGKRKRQELVLKTRFEVITFCEVNPQVGERKVAEKIKCGKTQVQGILLKKEEIIKDFEANVSSKKKRCRGVNNDEIEKTLLDWFRKVRSRNIPVTGPMLQEKARQVADALSLSQEDFKATNGWLDRFKNRNGI